MILMATAILGFLHTSGFERATSLIHKTPELFHFSDALDGLSDDFRFSVYPESFFGAVERALIDEIGLTPQF
jgi:hypothetical protein